MCFSRTEQLTETETPQENYDHKNVFISWNCRVGWSENFKSKTLGSKKVQHIKIRLFVFISWKSDQNWPFSSWKTVFHALWASSKYKNLFISKSFQQKATKIYNPFNFVIMLLLKNFFWPPPPLTLYFWTPRALKKPFFVILGFKCSKISQTMKVMSQNRYSLNGWNIIF